MGGARPVSVLSLQWKWEGTLAQTISRSAKGVCPTEKQIVHSEAEFRRVFSYVDDQYLGGKRRIKLCQQRHTQ